MRQFDRRTWMQMTAGATVLSAASYANAVGANERVRVAVIGTGGMGSYHVDAWRLTPNAELVYLCDVDSSRLAQQAKKDVTLKTVSDLRKVLDDSTVDAVSIATPDHWHAPAALLALEAGKHVYVEKPCAHNLREAQLLVAATEKNGRVVQHGTQSRSNPFLMAAIQLLHDGIIGDVLVAKAWNVQRRGNIGFGKPSTPPASVDYDTWLGPAEEVPFQANRFHYGWHWWYDFGTGDMGNDGVHDIDIARWGLSATGLPTKTSAIGGKYVFDDDQQFPDTLATAFEYPGDGSVGKRRQLIFEMRLWSRNAPMNVDNGCEFHGSQGSMFLSKAGKIQVIDADKKPISVNDKVPPPGSHMGALGDHFNNFIAAIREQKPLNAPIAVGYESTALCHLGNIAVRVGRSLTLDPKTVQIADDGDANQLLTRRYRSTHWSVPKGLG